MAILKQRRYSFFELCPVARVLLMRLLVHNLLQCQVKGCNAYPLKFLAAGLELDRQSTDFNEEFLNNLLIKIDYPVLRASAASLGLPDCLPADLPAERSPEFLQDLHSTLLETFIKQGTMKCDGCGHEYPIVNCIPNMLLKENESI